MPCVVPLFRWWTLTPNAANATNRGGPRCRSEPHEAREISNPRRRSQRSSRSCRAFLNCKGWPDEGDGLLGEAWSHFDKRLPAESADHQRASWRPRRVALGFKKRADGAHENNFRVSSSTSMASVSRCSWIPEHRRTSRRTRYVACMMADRACVRRAWLQHPFSPPATRPTGRGV